MSSTLFRMALARIAPYDPDWPRDYLRAHTEAATSYATLKRRLADLSMDTDVYPDIKDPVTDLIMVAAEEWAGRTGWHPDPSDA